VLKLMRMLKMMRIFRGMRIIKLYETDYAINYQAGGLHRNKSQALHRRCIPSSSSSSFSSSSSSTRSTPLYHKKLRGQIVPESRFVKLVDAMGY